MGETPAKFLVVEDEMIIGANISLQLTKLGYEVIGILARGEEAIAAIRENRPDVVLMDIQLKGELDGVETSQRIHEEYDIPIIFITANSDDANFKRAIATQPHAFISKPFKKIDLKRAVELTLSRLESKGDLQNTSGEPAEQEVLSDSIFVRHQDKMVKVSISDIFYVEAERNYCRIYTKDKEYLLVMTLKELDEKLPRAHFIRVHRSYIINISKVDEVGNSHVAMARKVIPLSKSYREDLMKRIRTI